MLATAVWIDARAKADIGTVVVGDDALGRITKELGPYSRFFRRVPIFVAFERQALEAVRQVFARTTASLSKTGRFGEFVHNSS